MKLQLFWIALSVVVLFCLLAAPANGLTPSDTQSRWQNAVNRGQAAFNRGDRGECERMYRLALQEAQGFAPCDPRLADSLEDLANALTASGKYQEALGLYERCLKQRRACKARRSLVAVALQRLGDLYGLSGKEALAQQCYQEELIILSEVFGAEHRFIPLPLMKLSRSLHATGRLDEAIASIKRAISIRERHVGANCPTLAQDHLELASLYAETQQWQSALRAALRALEINKASFGEKDRALIEPLLTLCAIYLQQKDYAEAEEACRQATNLCRGLAPLHPLRVRAKRLSLQIDDRLGRSASITALSDQLSGNQTEAFAYLNMRADFFFGVKQYEKASQLYQQAVDLADKRGLRPPADLFQKLGFCYLTRSKLPQARKAWERELPLRLNEQMQQPWPLANCYICLGFVLFRLNELQNAEANFKKAMTILDKHPDQTLIGNLIPPYSKLLTKTGRKREAMALKARFGH